MTAMDKKQDLVLLHAFAWAMAVHFAWELSRAPIVGMRGLRD